MIQKVVTSQQCTGCGTCAGVCPKNAITLYRDTDYGIYLPRIESAKCTNCNICYRSCPGHSVDYDALNQIIFGRIPENIFLGNVINCYSGYSADNEIRYNSASGGLVTQVLIYALEHGIIHGALVTRFKKDDLTVPEPFIARTRAEIIEAARSKYCPVPANIRLDEILGSTDGEKFAVVGVPCHIHGVQKAIRVNPKLKNKIVLTIGLLCNHAPNFLSTETLIRKSGFDPRSLTKFQYRGEGWPGNLNVNDKVRVNALISWGYIGAPCFTPRRCLACSDGISELSDLSFGDAWLPEFLADKIGTSFIITKTPFGQKLIDEMAANDILLVKNIAPEKIVKSHIITLYFKKKCIKPIMGLLKYNIIYNNITDPDLIDYPIALYQYINQKLYSISFFRKCFYLAPVNLIKLSGLIYAFVYRRRINTLVKNELKID